MGEASSAGPRQEPTPPGWRVIRCGWFAFEGFGRPWEAWSNAGPSQLPGGAVTATAWLSHGRCFTKRGAKRRARRELDRRMARRERGL